MTATDTVRSVISHRGMSCRELHQELGKRDREIRQLRPRAEQTTALEARLDEQAQTIHSLHTQLDMAKAIRDETNARATRCREAEIHARKALQRMEEWEEELTALRQFKANVTSVSNLPAHDGPAVEAGGIQERFEAGPVLRAGASPMAAVTDPGQALVIWGSDLDATQPPNTVKEVA